MRSARDADGNHLQPPARLRLVHDPPATALQISYRRRERLEYETFVRAGPLAASAIPTACLQRPVSATTNGLDAISTGGHASGRSRLPRKACCPRRGHSDCAFGNADGVLTAIHAIPSDM